MKQLISAFCLSFFFHACAIDYDIGETSVVEHDRLVVNSLLNPAEPVCIYFYTTCKIDSGYHYTGISGVEVLLKENETVLYNGICADSILRLNHYPKAGATYTIEAFLSGYDRVYANTGIPNPIQCRAKMDILGNTDYYYEFDLLISLNEFHYPREEQAGLWITTYACYERDTLQYNDLYVNNMLIDPVNREVGMQVRNEFAGSIYYNAFLRVKNTNIPHLGEMVFTPSYLPSSDEYDYTIWPEQISVKLTTASKEYDQYCRSLYEQKAMIIYDDDISAIVYRPIRVYSNIENGLGIFAGMNEVNYLFDHPEAPEHNYPEW